MKTLDSAGIIKQSVTARMAAEALGLHPDRYGRCACPIHGGKDRNLKLFDGEKGYYCFVCHSGGDVIDLVCNVNHMPMREAVAWLGATFRLGLDTEDAAAEKAAREAAERRKREREREEKNREETLALWLDAQEACKEADQAFEARRPKKPGEPITDAFRTAVFVREELREINGIVTDMLMRSNV